MTDLGPLMAAVTDEWERGKTIAERAGIDSRTAGQRLKRLERDGFVVSTMNPAPQTIGDLVKVYRRGPNAAPVAVTRSPELIALEASEADAARLYEALRMTRLLLGFAASSPVNVAQLADEAMAAHKARTAVQGRKFT